MKEGDDGKKSDEERTTWPAKLITRGNVRCRIAARRTPWGVLEWRASFVRIHGGPTPRKDARSFDQDDLADLIQAAFDARRYIARAERRGRLRRHFLHWL